MGFHGDNPSLANMLKLGISSYIVHKIGARKKQLANRGSKHYYMQVTKNDKIGSWQKKINGQMYVGSKHR